MSELITVLHRGCEQPAFLYAHNPRPGEEIQRKNTFHLDETPYSHLEKLHRCGTCGRPFRGAADIMPAPPELKTYDMTSPEDMRKLYEGVTDRGNLP